MLGSADGRRRRLCDLRAQHDLLGRVGPHGDLLFTASEDGTARIWPLQPDRLVELACASIGRNLTASEWKRYFEAEPYRATCGR